MILVIMKLSLHEPLSSPAFVVAAEPAAVVDWTEARCRDLGQTR